MNLQKTEPLHLTALYDKITVSAKEKQTKVLERVFMLKELVVREHCVFKEKARSWEDAISMSCVPLVHSGVVKEGYDLDLIGHVKKYGPYIVLTSGLAMPHCQEATHNVNRNGISCLKLEEPVKFQGEKEAKLFFTLASTNNKEHFHQLTALMEIFGNKTYMDDLMSATSTEELLSLHE